MFGIQEGKTNKNLGKKPAEMTLVNGIQIHWKYK